MKHTSLWMALTIVFGLGFGFTYYLYQDASSQLEQIQLTTTRLENEVKSEKALKLLNQDLVVSSNKQTLACSAFVVDTIDIVLSGDVDNLVNHLRSFDIGQDITPIY